MKKIWGVLVVILIFISVTTGEKKMIDDKVLQNLEWQLPEGWEFVIEDSLLKVTKDVEVWILFKNQINAPVSMESEEERITRIKEHGKKIKPELVYSVEERWTDEKYKKAESDNDKIYEEIEALPDKLEISHLINPFSKTGEIFKAKTDEDQKRIDEYWKIRNELEKKLVKTPDYNTEKYSLFFLKAEGWHDEHTLVHPEEISNQIYKIYGLLKNKE